MFDTENDIHFCVCGKKVEMNETCGSEECKSRYEGFRKSVDEFFALMENQGVWEGYNKFEVLNKDLQIGILFEMEDELMMILLQGLGQEKVLELLQTNSDALRYRFLELLEPLLEKEVVDTFKALDDLEKEEIKEFLIYLINIIIKSVQSEK